MSEVMQLTGTARQIRSWIIDCMQADLVPLVKSSPGMGKSSIMRSIAEEAGLFMIDHRFSTSPPEDLSGLPRFTEDGYAEFAQFRDLFPLEDRVIPEGYEGYMLFLDEMTSVRRETMAGLYKLVLDKMVGQKKLHKRVRITAAGNHASDRAIVNPMGTAMQSRLVTLNMVVSFEEWLYDVALKQNYDPRVIAYLSAYSDKLMAFDPAHKEDSFPCPRTWENVNKLAANKTVITDADTALFGGCVGKGEGVSFVNFCQVYKDLVTVAQVLADPQGCPVPMEKASRYALITSLASNVKDDNLDRMSMFVDRMEAPMRILFFRFVLTQHPEMRSHPEFARAMRELGKYLKG